MGAALRCFYRRLTTQSHQQQDPQHLTTHTDVLRTGRVIFFSSSAIVSAENYGRGGTKNQPNNTYSMQRCSRETWGTCNPIARTHSMYRVSGQGWYIRDRGSYVICINFPCENIIAHCWWFSMSDFS